MAQCHAFLIVFALQWSFMAAELGVCYSPLHHDKPDQQTLYNDCKQIAQHFDLMRTYYTEFAGVNMIDCAHQAGIRINVGIQMQKREGVEQEIQAACDRAKKYAKDKTVHTISVGNENLNANDFYTPQQLVGYMNQVEKCVQGLGIVVSTVQKNSDYLKFPGIDAFDGLRVLEANIHPFFDTRSITPIERLNAQFVELADKYKNQKEIQIAETGWPSYGGGSRIASNKPSAQVMEAFFNDLKQWSTAKGVIVYWFMMYDSKISYTGPEHEYEKFFGLCDLSGKPKFQLPQRTPGAPPAHVVYQPPPAPAPAPQPAPVPAPAPQPTPVSAPLPVATPATPSLPPPAPVMIRGSGEPPSPNPLPDQPNVYSNPTPQYQAVTVQDPKNFC